jgi:NTP pyrophosphatase (non-canonical NTP hydrolase)
VTMAAAGVAKLIEECGELQQVLGKKLAWWDTDEPHWDGSVLSERMIEEMGDVLAAIEFVANALCLNWKDVQDRKRSKDYLFETWEATIDNNDHGIDGGGARG